MSSDTEDINSIDIDVEKVVEEGDDDRVVTLAEFKKFLNLEGIDYDDDILQLTLDDFRQCNRIL